MNDSLLSNSNLLWSLEQTRFFSFWCYGTTCIISISCHCSPLVFEVHTSEVYKSATFPAPARGLKLPLQRRHAGVVSSQLQQIQPPTTSLLPPYNVTEKSPCGLGRCITATQLVTLGCIQLPLSGVPSIAFETA
jgi:hypothetical protein